MNMKHFLFTFFFLGFSLLLQAQTPSIINEINSVKPGEGNVTIYQDESIQGLIGARIVPSSSGLNSNTSDVHPSNTSTDSPVKPLHYKESKGYKIQVFSGNEQRKSKDEAYAKRSLIVSSYPDLEVIVTYKSPVWRVRAGNYRTYEEAYEALKDLKQAFPGFGKEMQIVEAIIKLPVYQ